MNTPTYSHTHTVNPVSSTLLTSDTSVGQLEYDIVFVIPSWIFEKSRVIRSYIHNWRQRQEWLHSCCKPNSIYSRTKSINKFILLGLVFFSCSPLPVPILFLCFPCITAFTFSAHSQHNPPIISSL